MTTTAGVQTVTGPPMPLDRWVQIGGEYTGGSLNLTVGSATATATVNGAPVPGTSTIAVGQGFQGWMDLLVFSLGRHFAGGTGLTVSGLTTGGQVVLDANGEATVTLSSPGSGIVDADHPVASVGMRVSINPEVDFESVVQVTTKQAYAVLDATMGDVKLTVNSQTTNLAGARKEEVIARNLMEFQRTGQRAAALPFEPTGTITERQQYGFRAALWLEETVGAAQKVKVVLENVDRLNLTAEQEAQFQEQVTALLMDAVQGASDAGTQQHLEEAYGGLIETLADLSEQESFQAFTVVIDGRAVFVDMATVHEKYGPELIEDLAKLAQKEPQNPTFVQRVTGMIRTFNDVASEPWSQILFDNAEEFIRKTAEEAVVAGRLTEEELFFIGYGWGLYSEGFAVLQMANPQALWRSAEQMTATVIAAVNGSAEARAALMEAVPIWGLMVMNDQANALAAQGKTFEAGKKSAQLGVAAAATPLAVAQTVKAGVTVFRAAKSFLKPRKGGPPRLPTSFGRAPVGNHYTDTFFDGHPNLQLERSLIEVHHAVEQGILTKPGYQNIVSQSEVHSVQNLRGIRKGMINPVTGKGFHRSTIRLKRNEFYRKYDVELKRPPTKQELLDFATHIDDLYGRLFVPPTR